MELEKRGINSDDKEKRQLIDLLENQVAEETRRERAKAGIYIRFLIILFNSLSNISHKL